MNLRALVLFALLAWLARAPLTPTNLFHFDLVNFALALEDFNLAGHQHQPPGSPYYVFPWRGPVPGLVGDTLATWRDAACYFPEAEGWTREGWSPSGAAAPGLAAGRNYVLLDRAVTISQTQPAGFPPAPAASHSAPPASSDPARPLSDAPR